MWYSNNLIYFAYTDKNYAKSSPITAIEIESDKNDADSLPTSDRKTEPMASTVHFNGDGKSTEIQGN